MRINHSDGPDGLYLETFNKTHLIIANMSLDEMQAYIDEQKREIIIRQARIDATLQMAAILNA